MSDAFLASHTDGHGTTRRERCVYFESIFTRPALTAEEVIVKDFAGSPGRATAVVTDDFSGVEATYSLVYSDNGWLIDAWDL